MLQEEQDTICIKINRVALDCIEGKCNLVNRNVMEDEAWKENPAVALTAYTEAVTEMLKAVEEIIVNE